MLRSFVSDCVTTFGHVLRNDGAERLLHKREYHRRRAAAESAVLNEFASNTLLFHQNTCPACGTQVAEPKRFKNPVGFGFAICPGDGTVYMDPVPTDATLERLYNDPAYAFDWTQGRPLDTLSPRPHGRQHLPRVRRWAPPTPGNRPRLLDIGCATGGFLLSAASDFEGEGVELNADMAAIARRHGLRVTSGRIEDRTDMGSWDVITALQVIEHITEPVTFLKNTARLLRPGGIVYLNTPNIESASFALFRERHMHVSSFGHVSLLTRKGIEKLAERAGLELVEHAYDGDIDIRLHDLISWRFARSRFRHRMACYDPRLYHLCNLFDRGPVRRWLIPRGELSYQWAILRKRVEVVA